MKSTVLIFISVVVVCLMYAAYIKFVPAPAPAATDQVAGPTTLPTPSPDRQNPMQSGVGSWGDVYGKDGALTVRFRSADYTRMADGSYHLTRPEAEFYQPSQQVIHLTAVTGDIIVDQNAQHMEINGSTPSMPREGTLRDVKIDVYPNPTAYESHPEKPDVTITMPDMHFDTDSFQVLTAEYTDPATGKVIPADQVPVKVRGNFEFDGTGLVLYWNDETHEIKSLTVAHGTRLLIKDVGSGEQKPTATKVATTQPAPVQTASAGTSPNAGSGNGGKGGAAAPAATNPGTVFQATFSNHVVVNQAGVDRVWADAMYVDFLMGSGEKSEQTVETPAAPPNDSVTPGRPAADKTEPVKQTADVSPKSSSTIAKGDETARGPVLITWNGPLTIVPAPDPAPQLTSGQHLIRFVGSPLVIHTDDADSTGAIASYNSQDGFARMRGTPDQPLMIERKRPDGGSAALIHAQAMRYSQTAHLAVFTGVGDATFPDPSNPTTLLKALWQKSCAVQLAAGATPADPTTVQSADLEGNANILQGSDLADPRLHLWGDSIVIDFESSLSAKHAGAGGKKNETNTDVKSVVTTGNAHCVIHDGKSLDRTIDTDKLTVLTGRDAGKIYAQYVIAEGNVYTVQGDENLRADRLDVTRAPAPPGERKSSAAKGDEGEGGTIDLVRMLAKGNVVAHGKNGSTLVGDELQVEDPGGRELVTILGSPPALLNDDGGSLRGNEVDVRPKENWAMVPCPGTIDAAQASKNGTVQPLHIKWDQSAELRGDDNKGVVKGNVIATQVDEQGAVNTAKGDEAILTLGPKPTTEPTVRATKRSSKEEAGLPDTQTHFLQGKEIDEVTLLDHAEVSSVLMATDGVTLLRRMNIFGDVIDYYPQRKKLVVPVPGRMLVQDDSGKGNAKAAAPAGGRGATAFQWTQNFTFDQLAQQATFDSPVTIVHQSDESNAQPVRLIADHVVADFEPATNAAPAPQGGAAGGTEAALKLKNVSATGDVRIFSKDTEIDCAEADYDPINELLICRGQDNNPVQVTDSQHPDDEQTFGEVQFNTVTGQIKKMSDFNGRNNR